MTGGDRVQRGAPTAPPQFRVVIIDDHELLAMSLLLALTHHGVEASHTPVNDIPTLLMGPAPEPGGLIVLDLDLGTDENGHHCHGANLVADLCTAGWAVLIVTGGGDDAQIAAGIAHGALGLVEKTSRFEVLIGLRRGCVQNPERCWSSRCWLLRTRLRPLLARVGWWAAAGPGVSHRTCHCRSRH